MESLTDIYSRYLENRATEEEVAFLRKCFNDPTYQLIVEQMVGEHFNRDPKQSPLSEKEVAQAAKEVQDSLHRQIESEAQVIPTGSRRSQWLMRVAAVLFIGLIGTGLFYRKSLTDALSPVHMQYVGTQSGERKKITLTDGTTIWLSPSSSLEFPGQFNSHLREVKLEGEAFFEVAKDKQHPFIIHSGKMDTKVVGTSFMIRAYKEQFKSTVTVVTGIVSVSLPSVPGNLSKTIRLTPNHRGLFDRNQGTLTSEDYPADSQMLKRKDGILDYDGAPVQEVVADLARYYNLPIQLENPGKNCLCYGEFDTNKPIQITLDQLAAAINAKVVKQSNQYIIKGGCEDD